MSAAEGSYLGLAKQSAAGTANTTDGDFKYLLFSEGQVSPNNVNLPLDPEVGGGALLRNVVKVAVNSGGGIALIPRPDTLGNFLYGVTGQVTTTANYRDDAILNDQSLNGSTVNSGLGQPSEAVRVTVKASGAATGNVIISGNVSGSPDTETLVLNGTTRVIGTKLFETITSVQVPTVGATTVDVGWHDLSYTHVFKMNPSDFFSAPYYTLRSALSIGIADNFGEQFRDARVNMLNLEFRAPGFVRGAVGFVGGLPTPDVDTSTWAAISKVDAGPQFLTSVGSKIQVPTGDNLSVVGGSFAAASAIPLDEQYVVGSYSPEGLDIVSRQFGIQLVVKLPNKSLYHKMMYDPAEGAAWAAEVFKAGSIKFEFKSDQDAAVKRTAGGAGADVADQRPYFLGVQGNGQSGDSANIVWNMAPVGLRAQRQVMAAITGTFLASPNGALDPITITLTNRRASY